MKRLAATGRRAGSHARRHGGGAGEPSEGGSDPARYLLVELAVVGTTSDVVGLEYQIEVH